MNKIIIGLIIFAGLCLMFKMTQASTPWYSSSYSARKPIVITGTAVATQTNYPVKINVTYASRMRADFGDVRFTGADGITPLNYWMETYTASTSAIFWVNIPNIPISPGTVTIYMYYGFPTTATTSNGTNTFDFFDDFTDGTIYSGYTQAGYNGWSEAGGVLTYTTAGTTASDPNVLVINNKTYGYGYEIRGKVRVRQWQDHDYSRFGLGLISNATGFGYKGLFHYTGSSKSRAVLHDTVAWLSQVNYVFSLNTWYQFAFFAKLVTTTRTLYEKDWPTGTAEPGAYSITTTSVNTTNQGNQPVIAGSSIPGGGFTTQFIGDWDDVFVRKCETAEPTVGALGAEEICTTGAFFAVFE